MSEQVAADRDAVGRFWYRVPGGESGADVFDRVTSFLQTLYREIDSMRPTNEVLENVVIVSHGLAIRLFCMRYLHWTTEEFEQVGEHPHVQLPRKILGGGGHINVRLRSVGTK